MHIRRASRLAQYTVVASVVATLVFSHDAVGVGSGGVLNLVPQAQVLFDGTPAPGEIEVYVHPLEGSLVVVDRARRLCIALDKNKRHAISMKLADLDFANDGLSIDVAETTPYVVLRGAPHFNRLRAEVRLDDGQLMTIMVER